MNYPCCSRALLSLCFFLSFFILAFHLRSSETSHQIKLSECAHGREERGWREILKKGSESNVVKNVCAIEEKKRKSVFQHSV